jgi:phosphoribosylanthranilate isomerase
MVIESAARSTAVYRVRVKVCGVTRAEDALAAVDAGADAIGLVFAAGSPRRVDVDQARGVAERLPAFVSAVGVFVDEPLERIVEIVREVGLSTAQLHGHEPPEVVAQLAPLPVIRAFRWTGPATSREIHRYLDHCQRLGRLPAATLIDTHRQGQAGGTGETWPWGEAAGLELSTPIVLAGGLTPENVAAAIAAVRPFAVDVSSGVESRPGVKDPERVRRFLEQARQAEARVG